MTNVKTRYYPAIHLQNLREICKPVGIRIGYPKSTDLRELALSHVVSIVNSVEEFALSETIWDFTLLSTMYGCRTWSLTPTEELW
jgi:hypothetical protein